MNDNTQHPAAGIVCGNCQHEKTAHLYGTGICCDTYWQDKTACPCDSFAPPVAVESEAVCKCGHDDAHHWYKDGGIEWYGECWAEDCGCQKPIQSGEERRLSFARQKASVAWCAESTSHLVMEPKLAEEFAKILVKEMYDPHLGCATTRELLDEIAARCDNLDYRTIDSD